MNVKAQTAKAILEPKFELIGDRGKAVQPRKAAFEDLTDVLRMVNDEHERSGAVLSVSPARVFGWISDKFSFIANDTVTGETVAHMAVVQWPGCLEIRSVVVNGGYQGMGIYSEMTKAIVAEIFASNPNAKIVEIKNDKSSGLGFLATLGFKEVPISDALALGVKLQEPTGRHAHMLTAEDYNTKVNLADGLRE